MSTTVKNIFGVAAAVVVLLGFNLAIDNESVTLSDSAAIDKVESAENKPVASLKDFNDAIVDIAENTNPSVVTITTKRVEEVRVINPFSQFFGNPRGDGETRERVQRGLGSGVIVSEEGYILTNNHVIEQADEIQVRLFDGNQVDAELIGTDPQTDIAVLRIDVDNPPAVQIGNSDELKVGSFVLAIGSPLSENLAHTVSFGIVSAKGRNIGLIQNRQEQWVGYEDFIQTDAAINPGNSGGALIDISGELVGINSAIASRSGGNDGIGFTIPINLAKRIMNDLIDDGEVSRGYLGMYMAGEVDQTMARGLGLGDIRGIMVGRVEEDGPADKAGLQEKDIIVSLNGEKVKDWASFRTRIAAFKPGDEIALGIIRNEANMTLEVTLGIRPQEQTASVTPQNKEEMDERLGFTVRELTSEIRSQLNIENETKGVVVLEVREGSNAYERGLRSQDIITEVGRTSIDSASDFYEQLEEIESDVVLLTVKRNDLEQYIAFEI
ncbi:Do family serine endopeptidase [Gracilimonas sp. BCB1]|uniref:Do family serine endopeptidase n=1 Tax=Gracilimonas sp. BCB1 TaxID=3152362 RepID=UPI0032D8CA4E